MRAKFLLYIGIMIFCFTNEMSAGRYMMVNDGGLNKSQKEVLKYAKKLTELYRDTFFLPGEVCYMLGDTVVEEHYVANPVWESAYFKEDSKWEALLVIPLNVRTSYGLLKSELQLRYVNKQVMRMVSTVFPTRECLKRYPEIKTGIFEMKDFSGFCVNSIVDGLLLNVVQYHNGEILNQLDAGLGNKGLMDNVNDMRIKSMVSNYVFRKDGTVIRRGNKKVNNHGNIGNVIPIDVWKEWKGHLQQSYGEGRGREGWDAQILLEQQRRMNKYK